MSEYTLISDITNCNNPLKKYDAIIPHFNSFNHTARPHAFGILYALMQADLCGINEI